MRRLAAPLLLLLAAAAAIAAAETFDTIVYGSTPAGIMAAVAATGFNFTGGSTAAAAPAKVLLISPTQRIGGMCSGGLGRTDVGGAQDVIGGLPYDFFRRNAQHYGSSGIDVLLEPSVALSIFQDMLADAQVEVLLALEVATVSRSAGAITSLTTTHGTTYTAKVFVDATYEGDLLPLAGVSYTFGREANSTYNESLAGVCTFAEGHEFQRSVSPYVSGGSGPLLPLLSSIAPGAPGSADQHVQAYNFRLCVTFNTSNMVPFPKPANYDPAMWELARRYFAAAKVTSPPYSHSDLHNGKCDMNNNGPISTDFIGGAWNYPDAKPAERQQIWAAHRDYQQGLLYFLGHDPAVPEAIRNTTNSLGLCKDEFTDTDNWPSQLYVREARRMVGDEVFTQSWVEQHRHQPIANSIGMGGYNYDSHNANRYACLPSSPVCTKYPGQAYAWNEGDVETNPGYHYQIPHTVLLPKRQEISNLVVPAAVSASHVGFATLRMEPQFMIMGQAAGTLAYLAAADGTNVQDVPVDKLTAALTAAGAILSTPPPPPPPPPPAPPAPGTHCTFQNNTDYDHAEVQLRDITSAQACCDYCGGQPDCKVAIFRASGRAAGCWPGTAATGKREADGAVACVRD